MNESRYDRIYNEGGEGYNPLRTARKEKEEAEYRDWVKEQKAKEHARVVEAMAKMSQAEIE